MIKQETTDVRKGIKKDVSKQVDLRLRKRFPKFNKRLYHRVDERVDKEMSALNQKTRKMVAWIVAAGVAITLLSVLINLMVARTIENQVNQKLVEIYKEQQVGAEAYKVRLELMMDSIARAGRKAVYIKIEEEIQGNAFKTETQKATLQRVNEIAPVMINKYLDAKAGEIESKATQLLDSFNLQVDSVLSRFEN
jgi:hypothetical protein